MNNKGLKSVLFVCGDNGFLSQMAEGFARLHGSGKLEVYSAGHHPTEQLDAKAISLMLERGCDLNSQHLMAINELPDITYDYLILFEPGDEAKEPPARQKEHWAVPDPSQLAPERLTELRDEIEMRVVDLISRLGD